MIERYLTKAMENLFTDQSRYDAYLAVEIASLEGWAALGVVPLEDLAAIKKKAYADPKRIAKLERITRHDVVAFTRQVSETLGAEKKWIHYGLTSTDVVDTALGLLYKKANEAIAKDFAALSAAVAAKALKYQNTPCIGRTHGMHAEVTSFGLKWANYYDELKRDEGEFLIQRRLIECCKLSGALGNYASIDPRVQDYAAAKLGLTSAAVATQVLSRDRHEEYAACLTIAASTLEKIALEIRNLSRTEIGEVEEGFLKGQKGSSAMPQKRNPIGSENICGGARMMRGYLFPILEDNALFHERDLSHSSVERVAFIDMIELFDYLLVRLTAIVEALAVFPLAMAKNITLTQGAVYAQRVLNALIEKGCCREEAYDLIQPLAMTAATGGKGFRAALASSAQVKKLLSDQELRDLFDNAYYFRNVDFIYQRLGLIP
jgi:adenylosuccinate lyase